MSDKWICNYWQYPVEKSQQKTVLFKMFITLILYMKVQYPIFTLIVLKILTKLKKVWIDNTNVWDNFTPGLQGHHNISCVTHMLCHSHKVIFIWCFQLTNMPIFLVLVPNNLISYHSSLFQVQALLVLPKLLCFSMS